jgi:hypothetical protein
VQRSSKTTLTEQQIHVATEHYDNPGPGAIKEVFLESIPLPLNAFISTVSA